VNYIKLGSICGESSVRYSRISKSCSKYYFVICSGNNNRQLQAIADTIDEELGKQGAISLHREGTADTGWMLLDFGDIIIHIFGPQEREYYRLERFWNEAKTVVYLQ
jgi:ribosome-associated protein